jgi:hypothetical protein
MAAKLPFQPHAFLIQIRSQFQDTTSRIHENVTWWMGGVNTGYTAAQLQYIANTFGSGFFPIWQAQGAPESHFIAAIATDWTSTAGLSEVQSFSAPGQGTGNMSANTAILLSLKGTVRYKGGHGRWYLPCIAESVSTDGINLVSGLTNTLNTNAQALVTGMDNIPAADGGPCTLVTYRQRTAGTGAPNNAPYEAAFPYAINQIVASSVLATQRRRLRKAAHH